MILAVSTLGALRHAQFIALYDYYRPLMAAWTLVFATSLVQWTLAIFERPYAGWSPRLDQAKVVIALPVYNEEPATLDRVLASLAIQTRLPDVIHVVDDGSKVVYDEVRDHWQADPILGPRLLWSRQANKGKKFAQAACFARHPDADIFVTIDSDTALARNAIEEGMKPFLRNDVYSVAGLELAYNHSKNWLTLLTSSRTLSWQLLSCSAQHVAGGDILVNRGTYSLYRADMIRDCVPAYLAETFLGHPVKLGDDAALTLFAECRGRAVQQPTAVCLAMYPERLPHHFRQWIRWMRGSTIRTFWRLHYLQLTSWSFWFTLLNTWTFVVSIGATVATGLQWPRSQALLASVVLTTIGWTVLMAMRTTAVHRSDQNWLDRLINIMISPAVAAWVTLVLRPLRIYGILTCLRQGWVTRGNVEILTSLMPIGEYPIMPPAGVPVPASEDPPTVVLVQEAT